MTKKAFTVEKANGMLPLLLELLEQLDDLKSQYLKSDEKLQVLDALWGEDLTRPSNPDHEDSRRYQKVCADHLRRIARLVQDEILGAGLRFPAGGLEHGLIDFPTTFEGRWVYLCWQRGEAELKFWHELSGGFLGRQEIGAEHLIRLGKEDDPNEVNDSGLDL